MLLTKKSSLKFAGLMVLVGIFGIYGCTTAMNETGTDTEVEIYSYLTGMLTRTYASEYHATVQATRNTLENLKIPITDTIADGLKTEFKARRADETPVAIEIVLIDGDHTQVSVSTGTVGVWDRRVSEQIHVYIADALDKKRIDDEKLPEDSAKADAEPTIGEVVEPGITEEDLAVESAPTTVQAATATDQIFPDSPNVIFFGNDSNELSDTGIEKLDRIYEILISNPEAELMLNGYSDSYGTPSYNQMISEIRANAVKSYLVGKGIDSSRIMALGHGAQKFIASNKTREGRRMNRRVEVEIVGLKAGD
jgi:outer membrane protein OmpA-like peptidoglycan-associated protein